MPRSALRGCRCLRSSSEPLGELLHEATRDLALREERELLYAIGADERHAVIVRTEPRAGIGHIVGDDEIELLLTQHPPRFRARVAGLGLEADDDGPRPPRGHDGPQNVGVLGHAERHLTTEVLLLQLPRRGLDRAVVGDPPRHRHPPRPRDAACAPSISAAMRSSDASRPGPLAPEASGPLSGSTTRMPRRRSAETFSCVAAFRHMCVSIAGTTITGADVARTVVDTRSSESPCARRAIACAVAGATTTTSACRPIATWPAARSSCISNMSTSTGRYVSAWN